MRNDRVARIITGAAALTLLAASAVAAQVDTRFPDEVGPTLVTSVITNALDDAGMNEAIQTTARDYHKELGGKPDKPQTEPAEDDKDKKGTRKPVERGGWLPIAPQPSSADVTQSVQDVTGEYRPNLLLVSGGDGQANASIARSNAGTLIVDLGQTLPCITDTGQPDTSGTCEGGSVVVPGTYSAVEFAVEDGAYLAGVLAAKEANNDRLGIISGYAGCLECERYIAGFTNGALSVEPEATVEVAYLAEDEVSGFGDPISAKTFTEAFIDVFQPEVLLPIGRAATPGMIEAACAKGIKAIGTGVDVRATRPDLDCVMTSVTKDMPRAVREAMYAYSFGENERLVTYGLANDGIGLTNEWTRLPTLPVDTAEAYQLAENALRSGEIRACPEGCGGSLPEDEIVDPDEADFGNEE